MRPKGNAHIIFGVAFRNVSDRECVSQNPLEAGELGAGEGNFRKEVLRDSSGDPWMPPQDIIYQENQAVHLGIRVGFIEAASSPGFWMLMDGILFLCDLFPVSIVEVTSALIDEAQILQLDGNGPSGSSAPRAVVVCPASVIECPDCRAIPVHPPWYPDGIVLPPAIPAYPGLDRGSFQVAGTGGGRSSTIRVMEE